jgi:hypothetical protein
MTAKQFMTKAEFYTVLSLASLAAKSGTAYRIRSELGLKKPAIRSIAL